MGAALWRWGDGVRCKRLQAPLAGLAVPSLPSGTEYDAPRGPDGKFAHGWHWNMPYSIKRELPDWYKKEVERYSY